MFHTDSCVSSGFWLPRWPPAAPCLLSSVLPLSPFSSFPPIGVCSLCTAIHQACHRSLRGGWRRLRGTWLISLLWLSRAARAFTTPFSTYSYSHFCFPRFIPPLSQCNYCTPLFLPDLVTSPFPFLQPSIDQHVCCMCEKIDALRISVQPPTRLRECCSFTSDRMFIKWALSGSEGFPDCLAAISS